MSELSLPAEPRTSAGLTERLSSAQPSPGRRRWLLALGASAALALLFLVSIAVLFLSGVGIWGVAIPVAWGFAIINFVWWIGLAHGGTLVSAALLLGRQKWRGSIARAAETMTLLALLCASVFPLLHLGRPNVFYWLMPYPNTMALWPQFRSALVWDVFAVVSYGGAAFLFWYLAAIPDLATLRDGSKRPLVAKIYGVSALGWRGAGTHWIRQEYAYRLTAAATLGLVFSFHTITAFAMTIVPGWHSTLLPPLFLAGGVLSGTALLLIIAAGLRSMFSMQDLIREKHLDSLAKLVLASSWLVAYGHAVELMLGGDGNVFGQFVTRSRIAGPNAHVFWSVVLCSIVAPQLFWSRKMRLNTTALFVVPLLVLVGVWADRFILVVTSLQRDYLPSSWELFNPTVWDLTTFAGSIGVFALGMMLVVRALPAGSISELRSLLHREGRLDDTGSAQSSAGTSEGERDYGLLAEYETAQELVEAAGQAWVRGHREIETFSPFPIPELRPLLRSRRWIIGVAALVSGTGAAALAYGMQYYASVISYPLNVGGRPLHSWPLFLPITFEAGLFGAALGSFVALLILNRLPRLEHPLFAVPGFERATIDRFFLLIPHSGRRHETEKVRRRLQRMSRLPVRSVRW